ncbi:MAG: PA14 domain-containing protein [Candidatus Brocadiaceae bacterium]|nr:PA14 domain-containing protein [Candidatus Brocadiaceae bacterium]
MIFVILFIIISTITGFLLTYFLASSYSLFERIAYGLVIGLGLHTWVVYLFSFLWGLTFISIFITIAVSLVFCSLFTTVQWSSFKRDVLFELRRTKNDFLLNKKSCFVHIAVFSFFTTIFYRLFYRIILWKNDGMYIGLPNNYGDLPLHLGYITSFVWGNNIPAQDPSFAGEKLKYPILSDFLSAVFLTMGADFKQILFIPGLLLSIGFCCVLYYFTYRLTKRRLAAIVSLFLFFFSGGFGFYYIIQDFTNYSHGFWSFLTHLPRDYTKITSFNYHWITPLTCLTIPQRSFLFGFPFTILIFSLLYTGIEEKNRREFLFAGILAGALPFLHTHSFLAMLMVTIPLGFIFWNWRNWLAFFLPAFVLSFPQVYCLSSNVRGGSFFALHTGWMAGKENFFWFWLKNTGLFWFAVFGGFAIVFTANKKLTNRVLMRTGLFSLPFLFLFLLPNFLLFAPWAWDNIKIFIYWFLGTSPLASLALIRLYEYKRLTIISKTSFCILMLSLTAAGGVDIFKYAIVPVNGWKEFSREEIMLAKRISEETPVNAIFLNAPIFNHPVFLSGRISLMGYMGHIWSHGYKDGSGREQDIKKMLRGSPEALSLINTYKPHYAILGPHEKRVGAKRIFFDKNFTCVITTKKYRIYDLTKKNQFSTQKNEGFSDKTEHHSLNQNNGLLVCYYDTISWEGDPIFEEINPSITINYSDEDEKPINSPFSVIWKGYIDVDVSGKYTFRLTSDDGSWLYIDNTMVINNGGHHSRKTLEGTITLNKGKHTIMVKYFDAGGGAILSLLWKPPNASESEIPAHVLSPSQ